MEPIWNDEDTRSFYEDLPQLRVLLPPVLFGGDGKKEESDVRCFLLALDPSSFLGE